MKHMKKLLALALVVMSVIAITSPAMALTAVYLDWVTATAVGDLGGMVSCIYSQMSVNSTVLVAFQYPTSIQVKFNADDDLYWVSATYGGYTGYMPRHHFNISDTNLRIGMFSNYSLERGHYGYPVRNLQACLEAVGFDPNGIDGVFGSGTESAVKSFQHDADLTEDGIAGYYTKMALLEEGNYFD